MLLQNVLVNQTVKRESKNMKNHCLCDQGGGSAIVVANVVERSSWEKSGCGCKCRFPAKEGLHHTPRDASLVTKQVIVADSTVDVHSSTSTELNTDDALGLQGGLRWKEPSSSPSDLYSRR